MKEVIWTDKKKRRKLVLIILLAVILASLSSFIVISVNMRPALVALSSRKAELSAKRALNDAILQAAMADEVDYEGLVEFSQSENKVYLMQTNTRKLNALAASTVKLAQDFIETIGKKGISIDMGTISGVPLFAGLGPKINATFEPVGAIQAKFKSQFVSAGINQTLHRIYLEMTAALEIALPGGVTATSACAQMIIAESIIVGDVPQAFTDVANENDMLNLIPTEVP